MTDPNPQGDARAAVEEFVCPDCFVERCDYEGPTAYLDHCPTCGTDAMPVPWESLSYRQRGESWCHVAWDDWREDLLQGGGSQPPADHAPAFMGGFFTAMDMCDGWNRARASDAETSARDNLLRSNELLRIAAKLARDVLGQIAWHLRRWDHRMPRMHIPSRPSNGPSVTTDPSPAVLEEAARAMWLGKVGDCSWERCVADAPPLADRYREDARAALQAVGYAEAVSIVRDLVRVIGVYQPRGSDSFNEAMGRVRAWATEHPDT